MNRVAIYIRQFRSGPGTAAEIGAAIERSGAIIVGTYIDDADLTGRGKYVEWRNLIAGLDTFDQIVVANAGDCPGRSVADLLKILSILRDHGVALHLHNTGTGTTTSVVLDLIDAYRQAKLSQAIRSGQARAVAAGKRIGRPIVPPRVQDRVRVALANGAGVRPTARRFNISPASVINIRQAVVGTTGPLATGLA